MSDEQPTQQDKKDRWDIRVKQADVVYKVFILTIGSIVAAVFLILQNRQTESRYYADLMAQREQADSALRAEMFKTLFDAYFKNKIQAEETANTSSARSPGTPRLLAGLHQETMLSDLLARNFDNVDIRPLLEDLDARLTRQIYAGSGGGARPLGPEQRQAFVQREQLRRVAIGAVARQVAALEGLASPSRARVTYHRIDTCALDPTGEIEKKVEREGLISLVEPPLPKQVQVEGGPVRELRLRDGALDLRMFKLARSEDAQGAPDRSASDIDLSVTFFDMPALENIRLNDNSRVAFSLYGYLSKQDCERFQADLDERQRTDCRDYLLRSPKPDCAIAQFRTVILPKEFLGVHDRPYVNDLAAGRYRDPWWKLW
jgi:hypothetical protein